MTGRQGEPDRTILFADVLEAPADDRDAPVDIGAALAGMQAVVGDAGGTWLKTIDQRGMAVFDAASAAVVAAGEVLRQFHGAEEHGLELRAGLATGPIVERDGDCFGDTVNIAARIADHCKRGLILTTLDTMTSLGEGERRLCRVYDEASLKGITGKVGIVQVVWDRSTTGIREMPTEMMEMAAGMYLRAGGQTVVVEPRVRNFVIGREADCDLTMETRRASRKHARILVRRGKFVLQDQSTNGTYVQPAGVAVEQSIFLRNESFTLIGSGVISLGARAGFDGAAEIEYEIY